MSAYLSVVAHAHRTRGNSLLEYAALALAVACLPAAAAFFLLLALVGALWALAAGAALVAGSARDRLAGALHSGRAALAGRLRLLADAIEPAPMTAPLDAAPSWEPEYRCPDCGEVGFDCTCTWSPVEAPAEAPGVPQEATQAAELAAEPSVAPEPADSNVAPPVVYLPLTGTVDEPKPLPEPVPMPTAAREMGPAAAGEGADGLRAALAERGSVRAAAKALGMPESTLRTKCKRLGIPTGTGKGKRGRAGEAA
jgi:hypothetical protein